MNSRENKMDTKNILPEEGITPPIISEAYRLKESELAKIIADISAKKSLSVKLRSRGVLINGDIAHHNNSYSHEPVGMLVYGADQRKEQKALYLVTFVASDLKDHPKDDLVDLLRGYICC